MKSTSENRKILEVVCSNLEERLERHGIRLRSFVDCRFEIVTSEPVESDTIGKLIVAALERQDCALEVRQVWDNNHGGSGVIKHRKHKYPIGTVTLTNSFHLRGSLILITFTDL